VQGITPNLTWFWARPVFSKEAPNFAGLAYLLGIERRIIKLSMFCQFKKMMVKKNKLCHSRENGRPEHVEKSGSLLSQERQNGVKKVFQYLVESMTPKIDDNDC